MSVVVKCPDDTIRVLIKGADSAVSELLNKKSRNESLETAERHLDHYSRTGHLCRMCYSILFLFLTTFVCVLDRFAYVDGGAACVVGGGV